MIKNKANLNKVLPLLTLLLLSCSSPATSSTSSGPHVHVWGDYHRSQSEHYRRCTICGEEEHGEHDDWVCDVCCEFKALGLGFVEGGDEAHSDFAKEANQWFPNAGKEYGFLYDFSTDFGKLNEKDLADYDLVMFLNNMPWAASQREAFETYMEDGGAWLGFHVCAFTQDASSWSW